MVDHIKTLTSMARHMGRPVNPQLGPEDQILSAHISPDKCWLIVRVAHISERKNGYVITRRGLRTILFNRVGPDAWERDQQTVWDTATPPQRHVTWAPPTPAEVAKRREWEDLCYRPGTPDFPLDNPARRAQGY